MKKFILIVVITILVGLFVTLGVSDRNVTINTAVIGDFSNSQTTASVDSFRAMELAVEELYENGCKYNLIRFDMSDYNNFSQLKTDIMAQDIQLVVGPTTSSQYNLIKDVLSEIELPIFLLAVSTDDINDKNDNLFRLTNSIEVQVQKMLKASKIILNDDIVVYYSTENMGFSKPYALGVAEGLKAYSNTRVVEVGDLNDPEIQEMLKKPLGNNDAIVIAGPSQAGIIAQLIAEDNSDLIILFPDWSKDDRTLEYTTSLKNEMYILSTSLPRNSESYEALKVRMLEQKNVNFNAFAYFGYEMMYFIDMLHEQTDDFNLEEVSNYIHNLNAYKGNFTKFEFNEYGDGSSDYDLMQIKDNQFILIDTLIE